MLSKRQTTVSRRTFGAMIRQSFAAAVTTLVLCMLLTSEAQAGRRAFIWTWDTETVNKGDIEIEQWLWAKTLTGPTRKNHVGWLWFSPVYGLFDHVEIAMPWEMVVDTTSGLTRLTNFTFEGRFRLYDPQAEDQLVKFLIRAYYQQNFAHPDNNGFGNKPHAGLDLVMSVGDVAGTHGTINVGGLADMGFGSRHLFRQVATAAFTYKLSDEWRVGAEYLHELNFGDAPTAKSLVGSGASAVLKNNFRFFVGPNVGLSRGRIWATLGCMIGLTDVTPLLMPRLMFAVAI